MLTHCLCEHSSSPAHSLPAQGTNSPAKESDSLELKPWLEGDCSDTQLCEPRRAGKPGLLEHPDRELIGVTRRSGSVSAVTQGGTTVTTG